MEQLTDYINTCWRRGSLPRQWKTAKMILIPKPGKPPSLDNLRPISLTSCVGKVMEHALLNRWQVYLEQKGIYPPSLIGFRQNLGTHDAMLQLKHQVLDNKTRGTRAILGLDLESAFDKVVHSAILRQISQRNLGLRTYNYVKDFLTDRRAVPVAKDLQLEEQTLGSAGTPQGSVISPTLFNMVMIGVAEKLQDIEDPPQLWLLAQFVAQPTDHILEVVLEVVREVVLEVVLKVVLDVVLEVVLDVVPEVVLGVVL
ncbi:uncharacterized protein ISCGN_008314 [Ixodes scapularis]